MLDVSNLAVDYGKHVALHGVSLAMKEGETVVILGANGAGKSSLLKAVAGLVPARAGGAIPDLTVSENLQLGAYARRARRDEAANMAMVLDLFPRLAERRRQIVATMSGGEQQMVAIGRALMSAPKLLMLDEPSLGLAPALVSELFQSLAKIGQSGMSLLIVEQNVRISLSIADRGYLLEAGRIVGEGAAEKLAGDPLVQHAFLGATADA